MKKRILAVMVSTVLAVGCFATVNAADYMERAFKMLYEWEFDDGDLALRSKGLAVLNDEKVADYQGKTDDWEIGEYYVDVDRSDDEDVEQEGLAHLLAQHHGPKVIRLFNITADDAEEGSPVSVTIADTAIKAGKAYGLYHMDVETGEWSPGKATVTSVQNGLIRANVTESAPYALMEL